MEIWKNGLALGLFGNPASDNSDIAVVNYANANLQLWTNSTERMRITGEGNVGIGASGDPVSKLEVGGRIRADAFITDRGEGSNAAGQSQTVVVSGLTDRSAYFVTATMLSDNCVISKPR